MKKKLNKVYDILVNLGGADENMRGSFIQYHTEGHDHEWRFSGHLGFGGKYRLERNKVDCYREDETQERLTLIEEINEKLSKINIV